MQRGLAASRERASALVMSGVVLVNGQPAQKSGMAVPDDAAIVLKAPDHPYVGRGGIKLAHALDTFKITVEGREALDIGASTGGFTDVLLRRGASRVVALDVGHGQLDWGLRNDPRVVVIEHANARTLEASHLPVLVDIITIDVSFISLRHIFPRIPLVIEAGADIVALVKPQFEAGRAEVGRKGVIRDPAVQARVVDEASHAAAEVGLARQGMTESPITGDTGNREFFLHFRLELRERRSTPDPAYASGEEGGEGPGMIR